MTRVAWIDRWQIRLAASIQAPSLIFTLESTFHEGGMINCHRPSTIRIRNPLPLCNAWMEERCLRNHAHANLLRDTERERGREGGREVCQDRRIQFVRTKISIVLPINYRKLVCTELSLPSYENNGTFVSDFTASFDKPHQPPPLFQTSAYEHTCPIVRPRIAHSHDFPRLLINRSWIKAPPWILREKEGGKSSNACTPLSKFAKYKHEIIPLRITRFPQRNWLKGNG